MDDARRTDPSTVTASFDDVAQAAQHLKTYGDGEMWHVACRLLDALRVASERTAASGQRERIAWAIARYGWEHGLTGNGEPGQHQRGEADAVLTALAGDPGDLPARMAASLRQGIEYELTTGSESGIGELIDSLNDPASSALVAAAMGVHWEAAVQQAVEVEWLRAEVAEMTMARNVLAQLYDDLDGKTADDRVHEAEGQAAKLRDQVFQVEAERDALKAAIKKGDVARFAADVRRLVGDYSSEERGVIALTPFEAALDQLCLERYGFDLDEVTASEAAPDAPID